MAVHVLIVFLIIAAGDAIHPVLMLEIPFDRLPDAFCEAGLGIPAHLSLDLVRCDGITAVMALAVFYISDQILAHKRFSRISLRKHLLQSIQNDVDDLDVLFLIVSADVVGLEETAFLLYHIDSLGVILYIKPVADILAVAVYRQFLAVQGIVDDKRDQLLRKLIRAVVVAAVGDIGREW